jgi:hypothetical protein
MANAHVGSLREIALVIEGTRGTKAALTTGDWLAHEGYDFGPKIEKVEATSGLGRIESRNRGEIVKEWSEGSLPLLLSKLNATRVMAAIMGDTGTGGDYVLQNDNAHDTFTVYTKDPVSGSKSYKLTAPNTITMEITPDQYIQVGMDLIGGKEVAESDLTPDYPTTDEILKPKQVGVKFATDYDGLSSATAITTVQGITLNIEKNVEPKWVVGSTEPEDQINRRYSITGDITLKFDVDTYRTLGLSDTSRAMKLEVISGTWGFALEFPSLDFEDWSVETGLDGYVTNTLGFKANYLDLTNGQIKGEISDTYVSA